MGRKFDIPEYYRSSIVSKVKNLRLVSDHRKRNLKPSILPLGPVVFKIARHFGFCFGVENAIEIAYRALAENPGRAIFLLSEMIHNPRVNADLQARGVRYIFAQSGEQLVPFSELRPDDIVIVPAFGTTAEMFQNLRSLGIDPLRYNATCPFVEKVWKRAQQLGERGFTVIIHGKHYHEETKATFSHSKIRAPSLVIRDLEEAKAVAAYVASPPDERADELFFNSFRERVSQDFDPRIHLLRVGVVNQTTMLATETQAISDLLRDALMRRYGPDEISLHFADTRDTLCYATVENQDAIQGLLDAGGDLALVVGGYNSSNTSHLAKLLHVKVPTFYIRDAEEIIGPNEIRFLDADRKELRTVHGWLPSNLNRPIEILVTAGASCPDAVVDEVLRKVAGFFEGVQDFGNALQHFMQG